MPSRWDVLSDVVFVLSFYRESCIVALEIYMNYVVHTSGFIMRMCDQDVNQGVSAAKKFMQDLSNITEMKRILSADCRNQMDTLAILPYYCADVDTGV